MGAGPKLPMRKQTLAQSLSPDVDDYMAGLKLGLMINEYKVGVVGFSDLKDYLASTRQGELLKKINLLENQHGLNISEASPSFQDGYEYGYTHSFGPQGDQLRSMIHGYNVRAKTDIAPDEIALVEPLMLRNILASTNLEHAIEHNIPIPGMSAEKSRAVQERYRIHLSSQLEVLNTALVELRMLSAPERMGYGMLKNPYNTKGLNH